MKPVKRCLALLLICALYCDGAMAGKTAIDTELLGLASQTDAAAFLSNPAAMHTYSERYAFALNSAGGGYFNDKDKLLDDFDDAEAEGERLEDLSEQRLLFPGDFERQIAIFERMDGKLFTLSGGNLAAVSLPFERIEATVVTSLASRLATAFNYNREDAVTLQTAPILGILAPPDLKSRIIIQGVAVSDIGLNLSRRFSGAGGFRAGITLKYQGVRLLERAIEIDDYEDITLDEFERAVKTHHHFNADIGLYKALAHNLHTSLVAKNINGKTFSGENGIRYRQRPGISLGIAHRGKRTISALNWDVVPSQRRFGLLDDEQRIRLGTQYQISRRWHISGGLEAVLEGRDNDAISLGAGYHWESGAAVNAALIYAGSEEVGGSLQVRFPFWKRKTR